ncbi:MAG: SCO family protein [Sideroxydans sp.]|nr:SCO family protein [Sideroxydans sp.]
MNDLKTMLYFALLSGSAALASSGMARAEMEDMHHHHHMMMSDSSGYQSTLAAYEVPDVKLMDKEGAAVSLRDDLAGDEPVMLNFIFTSCTSICPVMSSTFQQVQQQLGEEGGKVRMVSISIDPEHDTPARLHEYAERYRANGNWQMLTGKLEDSIAVQRAFGAFRGDKMNHAPATYLRAGGPGTPWLRLDGFASASDIIREYHQLAHHH